MKIALLLTGLLVISSSTFAQLESLQGQIQQVIAPKRATVGVGIYNFGNRQTLTINADKHLPMQSVYKFHVALAVLDQVDKGQLRLAQKMHLKKSDLISDLYSPLREAYPNGEVDLPLADIIRFMVADSDNSACDYLFRLVGGPKKVDAFIHQLGIRDVAIRHPEAVQQASWDRQYMNWTTPKAMLNLLTLFYQRKILSARSHDFLWQVLVETTTGENRLKKLLPAGTVVAHKTGTSGTNQAGLMGAVNDAGYISLPNGQWIAITVFVSNSTESVETNEQIIADIAKVTYEYFAKAN